MTAATTTPAPERTHRATGPAAVLFAAGLWGTVGPAQVLAASTADPGTLGVLRLLLGGALLALFFRFRQWRRAFHRSVLGWVLLAAAATGMYQVTFLHAVDRLGAALGTTIALGIAPVATGLCARLWTAEKLTTGWVVTTAIAVSGCVVLLAPTQSQPISLTGTAVAVLSGSCYGVYTVAAKKYLDAGAPALPTTAITLLIAGAALSPILLHAPAGLLSVNTALLVAWLAFAATTCAYASFVYGLRRTTAPATATLSLAEPLLAAALGVLVLREQLPPTAVAGALLLLAALITTTFTGRSANR